MYGASSTVFKLQVLVSACELLGVWSLKWHNFTLLYFISSMTDCNFCMLENGVLNWQTSYVWFMAQFKRNRKIICNHTVLLCLYMADPATFQASNSIPSSKNSLRVHLLERYIFPNLYYDLSDILSWNFFSKPAQCGNCSLFSFFLFCVLYSTRRKKSRQNKGGVCYDEYIWWNMVDMPKLYVHSLILPLICESAQSNTCNGYSVNLLWGICLCIVK